MIRTCSPLSLPRIYCVVHDNEQFVLSPQCSYHHDTPAVIISHVRMRLIAPRVLGGPITLMHEACRLGPLHLRACALYVIAIIKATDIISTFSLS
jgi:hypothetical protein